MARRRDRWFVPVTLLAVATFFAAIELGARHDSESIPKVDEAVALGALDTHATPTVLVFSVPGCHFCSGSKKLLRDVAAETGASVRYLEVDLEDARTLAERYGVNGAPTLLVFDDGGALRGRAAAIATRRELDTLLAGRSLLP